MKKIYLICLIFLSTIVFSYAQKAIEQISLNDKDFSIPLPEKFENQEIDEEFNPELPKTPPPQEVNIIKEAIIIENLPSRGISKENSYYSLIIKEAKNQNFDPHLALSVVQKESSFNPKVKSSIGAIGLMQLMPETAKWLGLKNTSKLYDAETNVKYGIKYLRYLFSEINGSVPEKIEKEEIENNNIKKSIAAYNCGPGNVRKYDKDPYYGIPPFKETQIYVKKIIEYFKDFKDSVDIEKIK